MPLQCTSLHPDADSARSAPQGDMRLVLCPTCSAVTNSAFDADLVPYDGDYENSQLFSPLFREWATGLASDLVGEFRLSGVPVVEVGSGKGEFLAMLVQAGAGRATGFDPTYTGEIDHLEGLDVELVTEMFDESTVSGTVGLVCSRHVLEHLVDPVSMLGQVRSAVRESPGCGLYLEVPNSAFTFTPSGMWDLIYQHCTYFSDVALEWAARAAGFRVSSVDPSFGEQFLSLRATSDGVVGDTAGLEESAAKLAAEIGSFAPVYRSIIEEWEDRIAGWTGAGRRVALWGGGAKGVTFLNLVGDAIQSVVDLNPRKQGRFLPGTGHRVLSPEQLGSTGADVVVIMNGAYEAEIRRDLASLGLSPEVAVV